MGNTWTENAADGMGETVTAVALGMVAYNDESYLRQALDSLLNQSYSDFTLYVSDDASIDGTPKVLSEYLARDRRIVYHRNPVRRGYAANFRNVFNQISADSVYFAGVAGHDVYHSQWLEKMVLAYQEDPNLILAYPLAQRIDEKGETLPTQSPRFETVGLTLSDRCRAVGLHGKGFGNMVYGLFKVNALKRTGVMRNLLVPDVVLIHELSKFGPIKQVPEILWSRRFEGLFSVARQRKTIFKNTPFYAYLPWPVVNSAALLWFGALAPSAGSWRDRQAGLLLAHYFAIRYIPRTLLEIPIVGPSVFAWGRQLWRKIVAGRPGVSNK